MSRDMDDLRHPEWSVSGSEGKSDYMWGYDEGIGNEVCFTLLRKIPDGVRVEVNVYGDTARYLGEVFTERAKHAALMEAAKAVRNHVGVLYDHPLGWKCSICGGVAGDGHFSSCEWYRFVTAIADLEASDD